MIFCELKLIKLSDRLLFRIGYCFRSKIWFLVSYSLIAVNQMFLWLSCSGTMGYVLYTSSIRFVNIWHGVDLYLLRDNNLSRKILLTSFYQFVNLLRSVL